MKLSSQAARIISWPTVLLMLMLVLAGCRASTIGTAPADMGSPATLADLTASLEQPGTLVFQKHVAANWAVPLSGLLNLEHPKSKAAGLEDRQESIQIYVYSISHPEFGTYLVDSGVASSFAEGTSDNQISWLVESAMNIDRLDLVKSTNELVRELGEISGVFLTHIHLDHIMGLPDLNNTKVYGGPGDAGLSTFMNMFTQGSTNRLLNSTAELLEWQFDDAAVIDVFGDGSFWAIHSPGHTPGATAYLAITTQGPQLMIGDATHTRWGWENGIEPGTYSEDIPLSQESLKRLKSLVDSNPVINAHPGHQSL